MTQQPYKRKVSNMLVDKRFQLKYTAFIIVVSLAIFAVMGWFYLRERKQNSEMLEVNQIMRLNLPDESGGMPPFDAADFTQTVAAENQARDRQTTYLMAGVLVVLILLLAAGGIYVTHKVAGPLFALRKFMDSVKKGDWDAVRPFRKGDEFVALADAFRDLADAIRSRHRAEIEDLRAAQADLGAGNAQAASAKLQTLVDGKTTYVSVSK